MLGKRVIKFERLKLDQILCADKTGFRRLEYHCIVVFFSYHIDILIFQYHPVLHECLVKNIIKDNRIVTPYISVSTLTV